MSQELEISISSGSESFEKKEVKKIGLFGFGTVGKGLYDLLSKHISLPVEIHKVHIQRLDLERINHPLDFTDDANDILDDPKIDIVVELISDAEAAKHFVLNALAKGKPVISANKKMIGSNIKEVDCWHRQFEAPFFYEAAVGGGIPILQNLDTVFAHQDITEIHGILNGSSNYILSQMSSNNMSFEDALEEAQAKGFAEANPSLDVDGLDASYKLAILGYHSFGEIVDLKKIELETIRNISKKDIQDAKRHKKKIKPVASLKKIDGNYVCSIGPKPLSQTDSLFNVDNENNAIEIDTAISGNHLLVGKGAGAFPTGSAVINDLRRVLKGERYQKSRLQVLVPA
ncbi:MAG: homoserine dehydrogenase [Cyclobacteriaceae bacterium]